MSWNTSKLNATLADRSRLAIMAAVAANSGADFALLLSLTELTKGNLSSHVQKLENEGYLKVHKEFVNRKPRTTYTCTTLGKKELNKYLQQIEGMLKKIS